MVECFFEFLLLFNDFSLNRLPPQVQGPSVLKRLCQSEDSLGKGMPQPSSAAPLLPLGLHPRLPLCWFSIQNREAGPPHPHPYLLRQGSPGGLQRAWDSVSCLLS